MFLLGHTGFTLVTATLLKNTIPKRFALPTKTDELSMNFSTSSGKRYQKCYSSSISSWVTSLGKTVDIRLLFVSSLSPDIVDKPVGRLLFPNTFSNGYLYCHTLLFLIVISMLGLYLYYSRRKTWLLVSSFGIFTHLILDAMWRIPNTLFWPLYGLSFEKHDLVSFSNWLKGLFNSLLINPVLVIPELIGAAIIIWFFWVLVHNGKLYVFLKKGRV